MQYSIRERYLWQLLLPDPKDPFFIEQPGQFRAELHDRLIAPFYPTRLRGDRLRLSRRAAHHAAKPHDVDARRHRRGRRCCALIGFASTVFGATVPWMLSLQYIAMALAFASGLWVIRRGLILEPPAFIANWLAALTERITRRFATP